MSDNAPLDEQGAQGILCASKLDGKSGVAVKVHPTTHGLIVESGAGQTDNGNHGGNAVIDENGRFSWYGLSSTDGVSKVIVYANPSTGAVLIQ